MDRGLIHRETTRETTRASMNFSMTARFTAAVFASLLALAIANAEEKTASKSSRKSTSSFPKEVKKLIIENTIVGQGKVASKGKKIKVNYSGWLYDPSSSMGRGKQFDSSVGRDPFEFTLGKSEVIKGWDEGFESMKVGGKRKLIIPAEMGYGDRGAGTEIPPGAALMFEVELIDVM
jgi:FKBP-type peptidyl-prolyl cis-trans isomerase FkpA